MPKKVTNSRVNAIFEKADPHTARELVLDSIYYYYYYPYELINDKM